jgi:DNA-binding transcriptional regulator LsrR (DeoR family)
MAADSDELITRIEHARANRDAAQAALHAAHKAYLEAVIEAKEILGSTELARRMHVSRQRVYQLLEEARRAGVPV